MHASAASFRLSWSLPDALATMGPPLLFAIRLWASVCLALFIAFWLELDNPYWAGGTAAIVCQPQLGASLRKGWSIRRGCRKAAAAGGRTAQTARVIPADRPRRRGKE